MKKIVFFLLFNSLCLCAPVCMKRLTHGFRVEKMKLELPQNPEWEVPSLSSEDQQQLIHILNQSFRYLDRGAQCYVFESEDGLYVIKLFRFDQPQNPIRTFFRTQIKKRSINSDPLEKIAHLFSACKLAYTLAKKETEIFYLHLNLTKNLLPIISLRGPLGRSFSLPLDSYRFALQKKAEPLKKVLFSSIDSGHIKSCIDSLFSLLLQRSGKGISNSDGNLFRNFGFIGHQAVEIDFGNYGYSSDLLLPDRQKEEISRFVLNLRSWLNYNAPEWTAYLDQKMDSI